MTGTPMSHRRHTQEGLTAQHSTEGKDSTNKKNRDPCSSTWLQRPAATQSSGLSVLPIEASRTRRQASSECLQTLPKSCMMMVCRGSHRVSVVSLPILCLPRIQHPASLARQQCCIRCFLPEFLRTHTASMVHVCTNSLVELVILSITGRACR